MKIMFYNIAYGSGMNGSLKRYLFYGILHFFWLPVNAVQRLIKFLEKERVDVICLAEVDGGSFRNRFRNQAQHIAKQLLIPFFHSHTKYHHRSIWSSIAMIREQHDAILSRKKGRLVRHQLQSGMQKLVQEYIVEGVSIFTVHLAVISRRIRQRQLSELAEIIKKCPRPHLVCGDFNVNHSLEDLKRFIRQTKLRRLIKKPTYPSISPFLYLDHFFVSQGIKIKRAGVINTQHSDHLPVWVEI